MRDTPDLRKTSVFRRSGTVPLTAYPLWETELNTDVATPPGISGGFLILRLWEEVRKNRLAAFSQADGTQVWNLPLPDVDSATWDWMKRAPEAIGRNTYISVQTTLFGPGKFKSTIKQIDIFSGHVNWSTEIPIYFQDMHIATNNVTVVGVAPRPADDEPAYTPVYTLDSNNGDRIDVKSLTPRDLFPRFVNDGDLLMGSLFRPKPFIESWPFERRFISDAGSFLLYETGSKIGVFSTRTKNVVWEKERAFAYGSYAFNVDHLLCLDLISIGSNKYDTILTMYDSRTGNIVWQMSKRNTEFIGGVFMQDLALISARNGQILAITIAAGEEVFKIDPIATAYVSSSPLTPPAPPHLNVSVAGERFYVVAGNKPSTKIVTFIPGLLWKAKQSGFRELPIVVEDSIIAATTDGRIVAWEIETGLETLSSVASANSQFGLAVGFNRIYYGTAADIWMVDGSTGNSAHFFNDPKKDISGISASGSRFFYVSDGTMHILGANGNALGNISMSGGLSGRIRSTDDGIYYGDKNGNIYRKTLTGEHIWVKPGNFAGAAIQGHALITSKNVIYLTVSGSIMVLHIRDGAVHFHKQPPNGVRFVSLSVTEDELGIVAAASDGYVRRFSAISADGMTEWTSVSPINTISSSICVFKEKVCVGTLSSSLIVLDARSGIVLRHIQVDGLGDVQVAQHNRVVVTAGSGGLIQAVLP